ncbi:DUF4190 domain-containing protein [Neisseria bacilliformis]|uniref:DUF4190 domain-containing protein n=1 Tax=Neisseria bacilliformis TaxID=267212 RepID=UPI0028F00255|nr:DUF4190 domain-containing protein [Neisseria bacilliformis]
MNDYTNPDPQQGNNDNRYYQAPQWQPPAANGTNGLAVASLVCSIIGWFIPVILGLLAIIFGHIARGQIRQRKQGGDGLAITGLVMGYIQVLIMGLGIAAAIVLPAYQDYVTRARLTEATQELTLPLAALGNKLSAAPAAENRAGTETETDAFTPPPNSRYWQDIYVEDGIVYARLKADSALAAPVRGKTVIYTPRIHGGSVSWRCDFTDDTSRRFLPRMCADIE